MGTPGFEIPPLLKTRFQNYWLNGSYDEMFEAEGLPRPHYRALYEMLLSLPVEEMRRRKQAADISFLPLRRHHLHPSMAAKKAHRTDFPERPAAAHHHQRRVGNHRGRGLTQRITALNLFLRDIYHEGRSLKAGVVPSEMVYSCRHFRRQMREFTVPKISMSRWWVPTWSACRTDRLPYSKTTSASRAACLTCWTSRTVMKRVFPELFRMAGVRPIDHYSETLLATLRALAPDGRPDPNIVLLTPGIFNSAYFEHAFLARQMGIELVEGRDLAIHDNIVYMRTTGGLRRVDVIYRRVDDDFIDPIAFRSDSSLGVAGLFNAYRSGNVSLGNALGTGVADDKAVYAYVPEIIRYFLGEEPIVNNVHTFVCSDPVQRQHVLSQLDQYVVKAVGGSPADTAC